MKNDREARKLLCPACYQDFLKTNSSLALAGIKFNNVPDRENSDVPHAGYYELSLVWFWWVRARGVCHGLVIKVALVHHDCSQAASSCSTLWAFAFPRGGLNVGEGEKCHWTHP